MKRKILMIVFLAMTVFLSAEQIKYSVNNTQEKNAQIVNEYNVYNDTAFFISLYQDMENKNVEKFLHIPNGCFENDDYVFNFEKKGDGIIIYKYKGMEEDTLVLPKEISGIPVTTIASIGRNIKKVVIPNTVKIISPKAFLCCGIKSVIFEPKSNIEKIGKQAFAFNRLESLELPKNEISIDKFAFFMNPIKEISIYKGWHFNDGGFFYTCSIGDIHEGDYSLLEDYLVTVSGRDRWYLDTFKYYGMGLPLLEKVVFEEGVSEIVERLFWKSPNLKIIQLPSTLKICGGGAFAECNELESVIVPKNLRVEKLGSMYIFEGKNLSFENIKQLLDAGFTMQYISR